MPGIIMEPKWKKREDTDGMSDFVIFVRPNASHASGRFVSEGYVPVDTLPRPATDRKQGKSLLRGSIAIHF